MDSGHLTGSDPAGRTLSLLSLLSIGREWTGAELAARLQVSPRTVRRDVERLRSLGYAVATQPGPGGYYRLSPSASMPPLLLSDDDVVTLTAALTLAAPRLGSEATAGVLVKLRQVMPTRLRARAQAAAAVTEVVADRLPSLDPSVIGDLAAAAAEHGRVRFRYRARSGDTSARTVDPYRQVVVRGQWYLLGVDTRADDWRTYRLDRIEDVTRVPGRYPRRELPAETAAAYFANDFNKAATEVSVVFSASTQRMTDLLVGGDGELAALSADRCRFRTSTTNLPWFAATTALLGVPFTVEHPDELDEHCRALATVLTRPTVPATADG